MKRSLFLMATVCWACAATVFGAATVTGTIQPGTGTNWVTGIVFESLSTPQIIGTNYIATSDYFLRTDTNGVFSLQMVQGDYTMTIGGRDTHRIAVDGTTNTYNFIDLINTNGLVYVYRTPGALVRVSTNDTTFGFLSSKLTNGANVTISTVNAGANEQLSLGVTGLQSALGFTPMNKAGDILTGSLAGTTMAAAAWRDTVGTLTNAGTLTLGFATNTVNMIALTGNVTVATSGLGLGRKIELLITAPSTNAAYTWPAWHWLGSVAPTSIAGGKLALLGAKAFGTDDTNVVAWYWVEP